MDLIRTGIILVLKRGGKERRNRNKEREREKAGRERGRKEPLRLERRVANSLFVLSKMY